MSQTRQVGDHLIRGTYIQCFSRAARTWSAGWNHLSDEQKRGAVALEILRQLNAQDESVSAERVRELLTQAYEDLTVMLP